MSLLLLLERAFSKVCVKFAGYQKYLSSEWKRGVSRAAEVITLTRG